MKKSICYLFVLVLISSFANNSFSQSISAVTAEESKPENSTEYLVGATVWYQTSAECDALYNQIYSLAKMKLEFSLKNSKVKKKKAIVTDLDETVIDNSPFQARLIKNNFDYSEKEWNIWVNEKNAKALPGSVSFFNYAQENGVEVFYISNRSIETINETMENLRNLGLPFVDEKHVLLKKESSDKSDRIKKVNSSFDLVLLLGDNLRDFSEEYANRGDDFGKQKVEETKQLFGEKYIVFPNPMYGEWEKAVYKNERDVSNEKKNILRKEALNIK